MAPPRRPPRRSAAAAESPRAGDSSWLSVRRAEPMKREGRCAADDDGLPLSDEALLLVFSALSGATADLVRCAATCRRWRRLVSADAAFICRGAPPRSDPFIRVLALGFFHFRADDHGGEQPAAAPRFVPLCPAAAHHQPSLAALAGASRVVASRNGRVVLDLIRRAKTRTTHAVRLGVCNPVAGGGGGFDVLPPLRGKDSPTGPYACTVITAAEELDHHQHGSSDDRPPSPAHSSYRVLLLYNRRSYTALRCYSSDTGSWGPETEVAGARIGRNQLGGGLHAAVVHRGVVFWPRLAVALPLDSLRQPAAVIAAKNGKLRHTVAGFSSPRCSNRVERLLGVMPDGRMLRVEADSETIRAYCGCKGGGGRDVGRCSLGGAFAWKWTVKLALMRVHTVRLRWLCEKSGVVIFTAGNCSSTGTHVYTLDVETKEVRMVATGGEASVGEVCGYEMDRVTLLASLGR